MKDEHIAYAIAEVVDDLRWNTVQSTAAKRKMVNSFEYWVQLLLVKQYGHAFGYISNPSTEIQMEAVRECGESITHIKNPSEEVQLEAVADCADAIKFIKNPYESVKAYCRNQSIILNNERRSYYICC